MCETNQTWLGTIIPTLILCCFFVVVNPTYKKRKYIFGLKVQIVFGRKIYALHCNFLLYQNNWKFYFPFLFSFVLHLVYYKHIKIIPINEILCPRNKLCVVIFFLRFLMYCLLDTRNWKPPSFQCIRIFMLSFGQIFCGIMYLSSPDVWYKMSCLNCLPFSKENSSWRIFYHKYTECQMFIFPLLDLHPAAYITLIVICSLCCSSIN